MSKGQDLSHLEQKHKELGEEIKRLKNPTKNIMYVNQPVFINGGLTFPGVTPSIRYRLDSCRTFDSGSTFDTAQSSSRWDNITPHYDAPSLPTWIPISMLTEDHVKSSGILCYIGANYISNDRHLCTTHFALIPFPKLITE